MNITYIWEGGESGRVDVEDFLLEQVAKVGSGQRFTGIDFRVGFKIKVTRGQLRAKFNTWPLIKWGTGGGFVTNQLFKNTYSFCMEHWNIICSQML